jgi:hypothetical protein
VLVDEVEGQQRMAQMIEHAHEEHDVEALAQGTDVVDRELAELDVLARHFGREARLREVALVEIDAEHARGAALLHLDRVEAAVAADVEHGLAREVLRDRVREAAPFDGGVVAEEMVRGGPGAVEVDVVEPGPERLRPALDLVPGAEVDCVHGSSPVPCPVPCSPREIAVRDGGSPLLPMSRPLP